MNCGIAVDGIITLTKYNVNYIPETLELMHELGIHEAAIMLLATVGNAKKNVRDCYLTYDELKQFILQMTDLKKQKNFQFAEDCSCRGRTITVGALLAFI